MSTNGIRNTTMSKQGHILRYWEWGRQHVFLEGHNLTHGVISATLVSRMVLNRLLHPTCAP